MNWRVDIAKVPLVRRNLTIGLHVPLSRKQIKLLLCKSRVDHSKRNTVESGVPSSEEGVFPPRWLSERPCVEQNETLTCQASTEYPQCASDAIPRK